MEIPDILLPGDRVHIQDIRTNDSMIIDQESAQDSYALTFILLCFSPIAASISFCPMSKKNPPRLKAPPLYLGIVQLLGHFVQQFGNCPTTGWFFLTGPPLKMSLDWPPPKMP